jgi:phenylpyruvate tautomerase PptA (4-oxalocrotonate tautomerase family)
MPLYTVAIQAGILDEGAKARLAESLTILHSEYASVPKNWVHVIFHEFPASCGFTAGQAAAMASLTLLIRTGRSAEYKRELLVRLWKLVQATTGAADDQIVLGIQEVPASQAMEMGRVMPDVPDP